MRRHERYSVKSLVSAGTGAVPLLLALVLISSSSSSFSACFTNKKIILSCHAFQTNLPTRHRNFGHASSAGITKQQKQTTELGISLDDFFGKSNPFGRNQDGSDDGKDKQEEDENYNVVEGNMLNIDSAVSSSFVDDVIIDTDIGIGIPRMNIEPFDEDDYAAGTTLISTIPGNLSIQSMSKIVVPSLHSRALFHSYRIDTVCFPFFVNHPHFPCLKTIEISTIIKTGWIAIIFNVLSDGDAKHAVEKFMACRSTKQGRVRC